MLHAEARARCRHRLHPENQPLTAPVQTLSLTLRTDVVVIQHILFHILDADLGKASFAQQLLRLVSAPHCSETLTTEGQ